MEIIKIIGIGLISLILVIMIKQYKPEYALFISIICGILIILICQDKIIGLINLFKELNTKTNLNFKYIDILLKITGISILTEFTVSLCNDAGETAIGAKVDLGGKLLIISISIPIIIALLELVVKILP